MRSTLTTGPKFRDHLCLLFLPLASKLVSVSIRFLVPIVLVLTLLGSYALTSGISGPFTVVIAGGLGYFLRRNNYPIAPMVIGLLLGRVAEGELLRSYQLSGGDPLYILSRPIALCLIGGTIFLWTLRMGLRKYDLFKSRA